MEVGRLELSTGVGLPYRSVGPPEATPVLLLHAWAESSRAFDRLVDVLPSTMRVMAVDQRGHGRADVPETGYSLVDFADDVAAFVEAAGLAPPVLLGASSGGYVAQQVAVTHPERVAGLVLVGSPAPCTGGRPSRTRSTSCETRSPSRGSATRSPGFPSSTTSRGPTSRTG